MSSSVLGLHSAPRAHSGPAAAGGSFGGGPRPAAPAGHPRPADPAGYCGRRCVAEHCGLEPVVRSRRWRSGSVGPPGQAHGCPELVKPILLTDIGVCMFTHPSGRASRGSSMAASRVGPFPLLRRYGRPEEVLVLVSGYTSSHLWRFQLTDRPGPLGCLGYFSRGHCPGYSP